MSAKSEKFQYLTSFSRVAFFYFIGLSIFFIVGFIIITLRVSGKEKVKVPSLVGKLYLDEHNRLVDNAFKVEIDRNFSTEYPFGYIMAQSISAGRVVKEGAKLVLLVNQSKTIVKTPNLVGIARELADGKLKNIHIDNRSFFLNLGIVTYIHSEADYDEVLAQFPPADTPVVPEHPVSLLVSKGPLNKKVKTKKGKKGRVRKKKTTFKAPQLLGTDIELAKRIAHYHQIPLRIQTKETKDAGQHGKVLEASLSSGKNKIDVAEIGTLEWKVTVGRFPYANQDNLPYRLVWLDDSDHDMPEGRVTVAHIKGERLAEVQLAAHLSAPVKKGSSYERAAFLLVEDNVAIPFFQSTQDEFVVWEGYESLLDQQAAGEESDDSSRAVFEDAEHPSAEKAKEPVNTFELEALDV